MILLLEGVSLSSTIGARRERWAIAEFIMSQIEWDITIRR